MHPSRAYFCSGKNTDYFPENKYYRKNPGILDVGTFLTFEGTFLYVSILDPNVGLKYVRLGCAYCL